MNVVILGLLDISCSEYKINEHELYNDIREQTKTGVIKCPNCKNNMGMHGTYKRKVIVSEFEVQTVNIIQVRCKKCRKVHAVIPGFILPKKQYNLKLIESAVGDYTFSTCIADDSTIRRWRQIIKPNCLTR